MEKQETATKSKTLLVTFLKKKSNELKAFPVCTYRKDPNWFPTMSPNGDASQRGSYAVT